MAVRFKRVVVKLSGEALSANTGWGVDPEALDRMADQILTVHEIGVQIAVVVGGGNYPDAVRYRQLSYREALNKGIAIMDTNAFVLAEEQHLLMHIFDVDGDGLMRDSCLGHDVGTTITAA